MEPMAPRTGFPCVGCGRQPDTPQHEFSCLSVAPAATTRHEPMTPRPVDALFPDAAAAKRAGLCPKCREAVDVTEFLSDVDYAEHKITGYCLGCMTVVYQQFAEMEEEG